MSQQRIADQEANYFKHMYVTNRAASLWIFAKREVKGRRAGLLPGGGPLREPSATEYSN
jgi:hypothetical protein